MFDASVLDLDNGGTLEGLYNKMQELFNSGKPLLLCNVKYGSYEYKSLFVNFYFDTTSSDFYITWVDDGDNQAISIESDDSYSM